MTLLRKIGEFFQSVALLASLYIVRPAKPVSDEQIRNWVAGYREILDKHGIPPTVIESETRRFEESLRQNRS